jgi:hypothetical protein
MNIEWPAPQSSDQFDLSEAISGLIDMMPFFMMTKFVLSTPTQTKSPSEHKPIIEHALIKKIAPVKPAPFSASTPVRIQEPPQSLFTPALTPEPHGRAMGWPRPGWVMKEVLTKDREIYTGAYVSWASVFDIYKTYIELINNENKLRDRYHKLKGPTLHSFDTHFRFAEYLGLVEKAGYEQTKSGMKRTAYKITQRGIDDDTSWDNLCGAWKELRSKITFKLPRSLHNG